MRVCLLDRILLLKKVQNTWKNRIGFYILHPLQNAFGNQAQGHSHNIHHIFYLNHKKSVFSTINQTLFLGFCACACWLATIGLVCRFTLGKELLMHSWFKHIYFLKIWTFIS